MFAVKGVYDGNSVIVKEPIPVRERYEVIVTFVESINYEKKLPILSKHDIETMLKGSVTESLIGALPHSDKLLEDYRAER